MKMFTGAEALLLLDFSAFLPAVVQDEFFASPITLEEHDSYTELDPGRGQVY
jgi:hypothetical protein